MFDGLFELAGIETAEEKQAKEREAWQVRMRQWQSQYTIDPSIRPHDVATLKGHSGWGIGALTILSDGRLASGSLHPSLFYGDYTIKLWDVVSGVCKATLEGHSGSLSALTVLPDGRLASGSYDKTIKLWDVLSGRCMATLEGHSSYVTALTVLPEGRLASGSYDETIKLWEVLSGRCMATLEGHSHWVIALTMLPDGRLASGSRDHTIKLWDVLSGVCAATLYGHSGGVTALMVLPDGRLASGSWDNTIKLWGVLSGRCMATLAGHSNVVYALTVLPDGRLASGSQDKTIKLWEVLSGRCTATLEGHSNGVWALTVLPDGRLASGSSDNTIKLWDVGLRLAPGRTATLSQGKGNVKAAHTKPSSDSASQQTQPAVSKLNAITSDHEEDNAEFVEEAPTKEHQQRRENFLLQARYIEEAFGHLEIQQKYTASTKRFQAPVGIAFVGQTGAGKSTLINFLLGRRLILWDSDEHGKRDDRTDGYLYLDDSEDRTLAASMAEKAESCTQYINQFPILDVPVGEMRDKTCVIYDTPGFGDTDDNRRLANGLLLEEMIKYHGGLCIAVILSSDQFNSQGSGKGDDFKKLARHLGLFLNFKKIDKNIAFVINVQKKEKFKKRKLEQELTGMLTVMKAELGRTVDTHEKQAIGNAIDFCGFLKACLNDNLVIIASPLRDDRAVILSQLAEVKPITVEGLNFHTAERQIFNKDLSEYFITPGLRKLRQFQLLEKKVELDKSNQTKLSTYSEINSSDELLRILKRELAAESNLVKRYKNDRTKTTQQLTEARKALSIIGPDQEEPLEVIRAEEEFNTRVTTGWMCSKDRWVKAQSDADWVSTASATASSLTGGLMDRVGLIGSTFSASYQGRHILRATVKSVRKQSGESWFASSNSFKVVTGPNVSADGSQCSVDFERFVTERGKRNQDMTVSVIFKRAHHPAFEAEVTRLNGEIESREDKLNMLESQLASAENMIVIQQELIALIQANASLVEIKNTLKNLKKQAEGSSDHHQLIRRKALMQLRAFRPEFHAIQIVPAFIWQSEATSDFEQAFSELLTHQPQFDVSKSKAWRARIRDWQSRFTVDQDITPQAVATLSGGSGVINTLAVLPNDQLASGSSDGAIRLWDMKQNTCVATLSEHSDCVNALAVLPSGQLASGSDDKTIKVWDLEREICVATLEGHTDWVRALMVLSSGQLVSGSWDKTIKLWDVENQACIATLLGHSRPVTAVSVLPSGELVSGSSDNTIKVWDVENQVCVATLKGHANCVQAITVLPNGQLASGSDDRMIKLWDMDRFTCVATLEGHSNTIWSLMILPSGQLASGSADKTIKLWDVDRGVCVSTLSENSHAITTLAILPSGQLVSGNRDQSLQLWDIGFRSKRDLAVAEEKKARERQATEIWQTRIRDWQSGFIVNQSITPQVVATLSAHHKGITDLTVLPNGQLASGSEDCTIKLWDVESQACVVTLKGHTNWVQALTIRPNGQLVSGSWDKTIKLWDVDQQACIATLEGHSGCVRALTVLLNGQLASGSQDKTIKLWDVDRQACIATLEGHNNSIQALTALPSGQLASGSEDKTIKLWDVDRQLCIATLSGHSDSVRALTVLPNGQLASGSQDNTIKLWDTSRHVCMATLSGHRHWVQALIVLPNGLLVSGEHLKAIKLWNIDSLECVATLSGHSDSVKALAVLPNGRLVSGSLDKTIKLWDVGLRTELDYAAEKERQARELEAKLAEEQAEKARQEQQEREQQAKLRQEQAAKEAAELQRIQGVVESCQALRQTWATDSIEVLYHQYDTFIQHDPQLTQLYVERSAYQRHLAQQVSTEAGLTDKIAHYEYALQDLEKILSLSADDQQVLSDKQELVGLLTPLKEEQKKYQVCQELRQRWPVDKQKGIVTAYEELIQAHPDDSCYYRELAEYYVSCAEAASEQVQKKMAYKKAIPYFESAIERDLSDTVAAERFEAVTQQLAVLTTSSPHSSHEKGSLSTSPVVTPPPPPSSTITSQSDHTAQDALKGSDTNQYSTPLFIAQEEVTLGREIGKGGVGMVYEGTYAFQKVAIKKYNGTQIPEKEARAMRAELDIMHQLQHECLVRLFGFVCDEKNPAMIVMEYGANGSLYKFLHSERDITWGLRLRIADELARGLVYLHSKAIIHRDIKSLNVVLDKDFHAKWCDFGLAVLKLHTATTTKPAESSHPVGTVRWMAPELFSRKTSKPSTASDIWALGMVFFELASREVPYINARDDEQVKDFIKEADGEDVPEECQTNAPQFGALMQRCWAERTHRPSAAEIVETLNDINRTFTVEQPSVTC